MRNISAKIEQILEKTKTVAIIGISDRSDRPSYGVAQYLSRYFTIIPVNPTMTTWEGLQCYPDLKSIPGSVDLVNIFRRSDQVLPIVEEAIDKKVSTVWMQLGIVNEEAAQLAENNAIDVVMDACIAVEHRNIN